MKITSLEIKQHEFEKTFRGYDIEEVDIFLNNIANEWERLTNENKMLRMQLEIAEKEATKLREVEMTLIKTLKSAEDTSSKITNHAKFEASKTVEDAKEVAQNTINTAENEAAEILAKAQNSAKEIIEASKKQVSEEEKSRIIELENLDNNIQELASKKEAILNKLRAIHAETAEVLGTSKIELSTPEVKTNSVEEITVDVKEEPVNHSLEEEAEEKEEEIQSVASSANNIKIEEESDTSFVDDLEIIEGIGPKIAELLNNAGLSNYRQLATTPVYKIKEILDAAGPHYAMHDPTTWVDQALLAAEEKWVELDELKEKLIAGRKPEKEIPADVVEKIQPISSEEVTEEMLDRVNKVKAALRKAMQEKEAIPTKNDMAPKKETLNDLIGKQRQEEEGGSFFDNIN